MRVFLITKIILSITLLAVHCGGPDTGADDASFDTPTSKVRTHENIQVVYDLSSHAEHMKMMKMMNISEMEHGHAEHIVTLTIMDTADRGGVITDADVKLVIKNAAGETISDGSEVMSGGGMHHYVGGFDSAAAGDYTVTADISAAGKTFTQDVTFAVK